MGSVRGLYERTVLTWAFSELLFFNFNLVMPCFYRKNGQKVMYIHESKFYKNLFLFIFICLSVYLPVKNNKYLPRDTELVL